MNFQTPDAWIAWFEAQSDVLQTAIKTAVNKLQNDGHYIDNACKMVYFHIERDRAIAEACAELEAEREASNGRIH